MVKKTKSSLKDTGERLIPEYAKGSLIYAEHFSRYLAAKPFVADKVILDIASGTGYGSKLLSESAKKVYGVDVDAGSVAYSKKMFGAPNIEYRVGDGTNIPLNDNSVDVVISFETIEHIESYHQFVKELKRVLKPDGLAVISTPNDLEFAEGNHFHVHEFTQDEIHDLLGEEFKNIDSYYQATWKYVAIGEADLFQKEEALTNISTLNLAPLKAGQYLYFYLLCSNRQITEKISPLAAIGEHYSERKMINDFTVTKAELDRRSERITELEKLSANTEKARADTEKLLHKTQGILDRIIHSRSYKLAEAIARTANAPNKLLKRQK